ncbi:MAG: HAMP domain-containing histidine kinase [Nitrospirae bacterium]|nr:HAMP domain-containing histidine kinase [Nitrospirota bacterium]
MTTHNILSVSEDAQLVSLLSRLERCHILKASTAAQLNTILAEEAIDIILLDLQSPQINALELAALLVSKTPAIPVVFLTDSFKLYDFLHAGYKTGAIDHLTKPIDENQFLNRINLYLMLFDKEKMLRQLNNTLQLRVEEQLEQHRQKDCILSHQARLASMGELIGQIAHHWRQPINTVGLVIQDILDAYDFKELDRQYISDSVNKCMEILEKMSNTIDEFRRSYKTDALKGRFSLKDAIEKAVASIEPILSDNCIAIMVNAVNAEITGYPVEFGRVIVSLLSNAKDALIEKGIRNPVIKIEASVADGQAAIVVADNAGGVPREIEGRIFDPYFTTKEDGRVTGLGLYTSKHLIERCMGGALSFKNADGGAVFTITVPIGRQV